MYSGWPHLEIIDGFSQFVRLMVSRCSDFLWTCASSQSVFSCGLFVCLVVTLWPFCVLCFFCLHFHPFLLIYSIHPWCSAGIKKLRRCNRFRLLQSIDFHVPIFICAWKCAHNPTPVSIKFRSRPVCCSRMHSWGENYMRVMFWQFWVWQRWVNARSQTSRCAVLKCRDQTFLDIRYVKSSVNQMKIWHHTYLSLYYRVI